MDSAEIRVLLCSPMNNVGGISRWTGHIMNYHKANKSSIELDLFYHLKEGSYQNYSVFHRIFKGVRNYIPFLIGLNKKLTSTDYNVIHLSSSASIGLFRDLFSLQIAKRHGVRSIIHFHFGRIPDIFAKNNWEQKLFKKVAKRVDKIIVLDSQSLDFLKREGYKSVEILPNPLAPSVIDIIEKHSDIVRRDDLILFAGHLIPTKGVFELIEACRDIDNIALKMVGYVTEGMKSDLLAKAGDNWKEWLEITGEQTFEDTIKDMLNAGIFVLPTYSEGFPNVILESMACASPIIASAVGAIPEMLGNLQDRQCGVCVEPKNVNQLKEAIAKMRDDREFAVNCGINAKQRVNDLYSMPTIWEKLTKIWRQN